LSLLVAGAGSLHAQSIWDSSIRSGPQFYSYQIKTTLTDKVSEMAVPIFVAVPLTSHFTIDVGTAYATTRFEHQSRDTLNNIVTSVSELNGLSDTQLRGNYSLAGDMVVLTGGVNLPTGSATVQPDELDVATRIGSDFLSFPISGFGSGLGFTGGVSLAHSVGPFNVGVGGSVRQSSEYTPFRDASGTDVKFTPGPEYRARLGIDHPYGTGRVALGFMFSRFGDDKANSAVYNSGDRYIGQIAVNNSLAGSVDWSFVGWNLYRTSGTLIDGSTSPSTNMTNAMLGLGLRAGAVSIQPNVEGRVLVGPELAKTNAMATAGLRLVFSHGLWTIVPGGGYSVGVMDQGDLTGMRATLAIRFGS
jgi:hypothetical protein